MSITNRWDTRTSHHSEDQLAVDDMGFGATDAGRAVATQGRKCHVLLHLEYLEHSARELGLGRRELIPSDH